MAENLERKVRELEAQVEEIRNFIRAILEPIVPQLSLEAIKDRVLAEKINTEEDLEETRRLYLSMLEHASRDRIAYLRDFFEMKAGREAELLKMAEEGNRRDPVGIPWEVVENKRRMLRFWIDMREEAERRLK